MAVGLFLGDAEARRAEADSVSPRKTPDLLHPVALVENPISEGGNRVHGETIGVDWADVRTTPGFAFGTESRRVKEEDSTALLASAWGPGRQPRRGLLHPGSRQRKR